MVAYLPSISGEFQLDDFDFVEADATGSDWAAVVRQRLLSGLLHGGRPVTELTLALDRAAGGLDTRWFHATNLVFHLTATVLVFLLARATFTRARLDSPEMLGAFAAAFHALHPLQTEAVSYISQRAEILASIFYIAVVLLLQRAKESPGRISGRVAWAGAFTAFVVGLGTKPVIVTAPIAWMLWDAAYDVSPGKHHRRVLLAAPFLVVGVLDAAMMLRATAGDLSAGVSIPGLPPWRYALTQLGVIPAYLRLLVWPVGQSVDHAFPLATWPPAAQSIFGGALLGAMLAGALVILWRSRDAVPPFASVAAFGVVWFLVVLAPSSSVVPLRDVMVEHRLYLASFGLFAAFIAGGAHVAASGGTRRSVAIALAAVVLLALGIVTARRNEAWRTRIALWSDVVARYPGLSRGHANLGHAFDTAGNLEHAVAEYRLAMSLEPPAQSLDVLRSLAGALRDLGRCAEAQPVLERAISLAPVDPELHVHLAVCRVAAGEMDRAIASARLAVSHGPDRADAHNVLAYVLLARGDAAGALSELDTARRLAPDFPPPVFNTVVARERLGDAAGACRALREYVALRPPAAEESEARRRFAGLQCPDIRASP